MSKTSPLIDYSDRLEIALALKTDLGEGPIWDASTKGLVFVDSNSGDIHRFDLKQKQVSTINVGCTIGVAIPRARGGYIVTSTNGVLSVDPSAGRVGLLVPIEEELPNNRMNDGKCDSRGRLWSGTLSVNFERNAGALYRVDPDLSVTLCVDDVRISNGIAWSPNDRLMYYNDTLAHGIDVFDYDIEDGIVSNRRRFAEIDRDAGLPDGMTVDAEGCVWVALFKGGQIRRYNPGGEWIGVVNLPVSRVTSCNFGGDDLEDLYITTADLRLHDDGMPHEPKAGYLFLCRPGVAGLPSHPFAG